MHDATDVLDPSVIAASKPGIRIIHGNDLAIEQPTPPRRPLVFKLLLQRHGQADLWQGGRQARLAPGDFALIDSAQPFRLSMEGRFDQLLVTMPRSTMTSMYRGIEHRTALTRGRAGGETLVRDLVLAYGESAASTQAHEDTYIASAVIHLMGVCESERSTNADSLLHRAMALMTIELADTDASRIAAELGVSRRYLDMLFARTGRSFSAHLRERRLAIAAERLQGQRHQSITEVAHTVGFKDSAHFARAFRKRYGITPSEWRRRREFQSISNGTAP